VSVCVFDYILTPVLKIPIHSHQYNTYVQSNSSSSSSKMYIR
jgi:hypothetical protein